MIENMAENIRLNLTISPYNYRKLKIWGKMHAKSPTAFAGQIVAARIEANLELIDRLLEEMANFEGVTTEEMLKMLTDEND